MQLPPYTDILDVFRLIERELTHVKKFIDKHLVGRSEAVNRLLTAFDSHGGKMLRPGLVLLSGAACGKTTEHHIRVAAIVETIHNATLLHDDVMDEGQKRRGLPTINRLWGNESAILLGDFLLSQVFSMCADLDGEVVKVIATSTTRICEGELRQISQRENWQLSEPEYIDIITEKSASLFSSCCYLGAFLAQAKPDVAESLGNFGLNLGIAFQIADDLLDVMGDEDKTGKTLGRDVDKDKLTLAIIHLLTVLDEEEKDVLIQNLEATGESKSRHSMITELLHRYGSFKYAHNRTQEFLQKAVSNLDVLEESEAKNALIEMAGFVGRLAL